jgi:hypothetical protein
MKKKEVFLSSSLRNAPKRNKQSKAVGKLTVKPTNVLDLFVNKIDMDSLQKYFYGVFLLPLP